MMNIFSILFLLWAFSCSHHVPVEEKTVSAEKEKTSEVIPLEKEAIETEVVTESPVSNQGRKLSLRYKEKHYQHWLKYFTGKNKKRFLRQLKKGDKYRGIIQSIFREHDLPEDLFYVGLIESGFYTHARSHASAVGPWQFIRGTGKRYKLRIDRHIDERRSIYKSTEAAAQYFKDLYNIFGSWELALCAYNAGEYRIINAIRKGNTRDYKKLVRKKLIPKETIFYIPKVAVARYLDKKWKRKIDDNARHFYENVDFLKINRTLNLAKVAKNIGMDWKQLKKLNPDLNSYWIRPRRRIFDLYVPKQKKQLAVKHLKSLGYRVEKYIARKPGRSKNFNRSNKTQNNKKYYHVRRGDNLAIIAKKFGTTVRVIKKDNRLRSSKILVGQRLKIAHSKSQRRRQKYYRVRKGDSLAIIAKKFGITVRAIKRENRLRSSKILVGQRLKIAHSKPQSKKRKSYRVRKGENLSVIARKFGTTVRAIKRANKLRSGRILTGQKLRMPSSKAKQYYIVKRGDNLTLIAQRFGVSIENILRINRLENKIIYPSQKIIIPSG